MLLLNLEFPCVSFGKIPVTSQVWGCHFSSFNPLVWLYFICFFFFSEFPQLHSMPLTINILQSFKHLINLQLL